MPKEHAAIASRGFQNSRNVIHHHFLRQGVPSTFTQIACSPLLVA
jgi:hypothetical protein